MHPFHLCLLLVLFSPPLLAGDIAHHDFSIRLLPSEGLIEVEDTITLQGERSEIEFTLHQNLEIQPSPGVRITPTAAYRNRHSVPVQRYRIQLAQPGRPFSLHYRGTIRHSLQQISTDYAGDLSQTPGIISEQGVFLSAASHWFPQFATDYLTFSIQAQLPQGWRLVSQGDPLADGWRADTPQDNIYIIAAPYQLYRRQGPVADAMVYLRSADPAMADRYLDATEHYLALYSELLGPYPYSKFALVENFWETGYGMPSFTLLGPTVIRLPFILHTSYPHEILHNWWGNSVYPDYASGNWSEGLTSYLADHLLREARGAGADYRRTTLQRYADSVKSQRDFPLTAFRARHGQASQAIGYGKTMMFFHMLRQQLGDALFIDGLRHFYRNNRFKTAGFDNLRDAFEAVGKRSLRAEFRQWTQRTGAPALQLGEVAIHQTAAGYRLSAILLQTQDEPVFSLHVPILVQLEGEPEYRRHLFFMDQRESTVTLHFDAPPIRLSVDPQFDLFRQLDPSEIPRSFAQLFGADKVLIVLPSEAPAEFRSGYEALANSWAGRSPALEVRWDRQVMRLPEDRAVWLFGQHNRLLRHIEGTAGKGRFALRPGQLLIHKRTFPAATHSAAVALPNPSGRQQTVGWLAAHSPDLIQRLGRKLPHYKKYSYLAFEGTEARNVYKGKWPLRRSALQRILGEDPAMPEPPLPPRPALTDLIQQQ